MFKISAVPVACIRDYHTVYRKCRYPHPSTSMFYTWHLAEVKMEQRQKRVCDVFIKHIWGRGGASTLPQFGNLWPLSETVREVR